MVNSCNLPLNLHGKYYLVEKLPSIWLECSNRRGQFIDVGKLLANRRIFLCVSAFEIFFDSCFFYVGVKFFSIHFMQRFVLYYSKSTI